MDCGEAMELLRDDEKAAIIKLIDGDLQFVDLPKHLLCSNCGSVPLFHHTYPCSHPYCRICFVDVFQRHKKKCRVCKTELGTEMSQSKDIEFAIYRLKVICPNELLGCKEEITLHRILGHLEECKFSRERQLPILYNPNKDETEKGTPESVILNRTITDLKAIIDELIKSNRDSEEWNKRLTEENVKLSAYVQKLAADVRLFMSANERKNTFLMEQMEQVESKSKEEVSEIRKHLASLDQQMKTILETKETISPSILEKLNARISEMEANHQIHSQNYEKKLSVFKTQIEQKFNERFNSSQEKVKIMFDALKKKEDSIDQKDIEDQRRRSSLRLNTLTQKEITEKIMEICKWRNGVLLWKIEDCEKKIKNDETVYSDPFYSSACGHKMRAQIKCSVMIWCKIQPLPGEYDDLPSGFHFRVTWTILDQSDGSQRRNATIIDEPRFGTSEQQWVENGGNIWKSTFCALLKKENKNRYLKNNTMYVKVIVEPLSQLFGNYFLRNGILLWTIDNYDRTKRESQEWTNPNVCSDYFYSGKQGFRMQALLNLGFSRFCFCLSFLVGEYDKNLPFFYSHKWTLSVVDQTDDSIKNNLVLGMNTLNAAVVGEEQVKQKMTEYSCHSIVIDYGKVEKRPFLVNNKIVLKVVVQKL